MTHFRTFRNGDPPALAALWNRALPARATARPPERARVRHARHQQGALRCRRSDRGRTRRPDRRVRARRVRTRATPREAAPSGPHDGDDRYPHSRGRCRGRGNRARLDRRGRELPPLPRGQGHLRRGAVSPQPVLLGHLRRQRVGGHPHLPREFLGAASSKPATSP